jgi:hypothetical protein
MNESNGAMALVSDRPAGGALAQRAARPLILKESLAMESEQRKLLGDYVKSEMIEGVDYGVIPGTERKDKDGRPLPTPKSLLKPGAEKLTSLFRCVAEFELVEVIRDFAKPLFFFEFRCRIKSLDTGGVVAEGFGSANSHESKYRYRNADRKCPQCGQAAIKRSKFRPKDENGQELDAEPGWYCFGKINGCGAQFDADDPDITSQAAGKVENPDVADQANSIMKIAKKRAHVDAAITLARCSDMFTQDVGDDEDVPAASGSRDTAKGAARPSKANAEAEATAALRQQLDVAVRELAGLRDVDTSVIYPALIEEAKKAWKGAGACPDRLESMPAGGIQYLIGKASRWLSAARKKAQEAPKRERQPGEDDFGDEATNPTGEEQIPY